MTQSLSDRAARLAAASVAVLLGAYLAARLGLEADIIKRAAGVRENARGVDRLVSAANELTTPAIVAVGAITPLAMIIGGGLWMVGSRKGIPLIGGAVAALVFVGAVSGLVK